MGNRTLRVALAMLTLSSPLFAGCSLAFDPARHHGDVDGGPLTDGRVPPGDVGVVPDAGMCTDDDADGDGYRECDGDCDDTDPLRYPDATPQCGDGVQLSCNFADRDRLRALLGGEVGVFVIRRPLGAVPRDMQFALTPGFSDPRGHPTFAVVGMLGEGPSLDVRTINLAYFEDIRSFDEAGLLGSTPTAISAFSLAPANDFDSREMFMGVLGDILTAPGVTTVFSSEHAGPTTTGISAPIDGATLIATSAHSLRSDTSSHVVAVGNRITIVDPRAGTIRGTATTLSALTGVERLSTSGDGVVLVHTTQPSQLGMVFLPDGTGVLDDAAIVGTSAVLARDGMNAAALSFVSNAGATEVSVGRAACTVGTCDVEDTSIAPLLTVGPGETVGAIAGAVLNDGATNPVAIMHAVLATGGERDRVLLSILRPNRVPIEMDRSGATFMPLQGAIPRGGRVHFMAVSAASQDFGFVDGGPIFTYRIIVVAMIVEAGGITELVLTGLRACEMI